MPYQPGTSDGADPTVTRTDSPLPFPEFRGNVWGPYNSPGDRFQRMGTRDCLQDLFLNGDMGNLFGNPIIKPWINPQDIITDPTIGLYFPSFITVTFGNIDDATNPNIVNAMRILSNGYGALDVKATGDSGTLTHRFQEAGGQGPDINGVPGTIGYSATVTGGAWVDNNVVGGTGEFNDEIGIGSGAADKSTNITVEFSTAGGAPGDNSGTSPIVNRISWYDLGPQ